jgi:hypothetical protein
LFVEVAKQVEWFHADMPFEQAPEISIPLV